MPFPPVTNRLEPAKSCHHMPKKTGAIHDNVPLMANEVLNLEAPCRLLPVTLRESGVMPTSYDQ